MSLHMIEDAVSRKTVHNAARDLRQAQSRCQQRNSAHTGCQNLEKVMRCQDDPIKLRRCWSHPA